MTVEELDPFDLPEWLGEGPVSWSSEQGLSGHVVIGVLAGGGDELRERDERLPCDLLAVDQAYPAPVVDEATRRRVHQAWHHGQVLLLAIEGRATVASPGAAWTPELVLESFTRLARAVGADPGAWSVRLSLGSRRR